MISVRLHSLLRSSLVAEEGVINEIKMSTNKGELEWILLFDSPQTLRPRANTFTVKDESKIERPCELREMRLRKPIQLDTANFVVTPGDYTTQRNFF